MTRTAATPKEASGIMVYLIDELGDARLRCAQLKKYIKEATDLIEKSEHRDHFFEVAGHLIQGVPDTMMRLDNALDAAAMAASRLDYDEIKNNLKPEKAEELENVLQDVRMRYLNRRSTEGASMGTKTATTSDVIARELNHAFVEGAKEKGSKESVRLAAQQVAHYADVAADTQLQPSKLGTIPRLAFANLADHVWDLAWAMGAASIKPESKTAGMDDQGYKTALVRLAAAKKASDAVSESEAEQLVASAQKLYKETHDLFDDAHRTKADHYAPIDGKLVSQLAGLHGEVLRGLGALSRVDSKGADALLTKDISTFGHMGLSPDTISEATGLAYTINNKALLVLWKARRAAQLVRFYTQWIEQYKASGSSPSLDDQSKWLRNADETITITPASGHPMHSTNLKETSMNAKTAAYFLNRIADLTEKGGRVPTKALMTLIAKLERQDKTAASLAPKAATAFRTIAAEVSGSTNPSRVKLAGVLRRILADTMEVGEQQQAPAQQQQQQAGQQQAPAQQGQQQQAQQQQAPQAPAQQQQAGAGEDFQKANPKITDEEAKVIDEMHDKNKDNLKG